MTNSKHNLVLGGGIAGLAAANRLVKHGESPIVIERAPTVGGLTRSIYVDRFTFDYTGHFLHLSRLKHPDDLGLKSLKGWKQLAKTSYCYVDGGFVDAPFQYNLKQLSDKNREHCLDGFRQARESAGSIEPQQQEDLLAYFYRTFGEGITDLFLKPYNEKILATDLKELSASSVNRFFPAPDPKLVEEGVEYKSYNSKFWYPEHNGIQQLIDSMVSQDHVAFGNVEKIDLQSREVITSHGQYPFDRLYSSIPLDETLKCIGDGWSGFEASKKLTCASVLSFQIGVVGETPQDLQDRHWIYVADPKIPFHRVGIYSNFNTAMAPKGAYNVYVEVGVKKDSPIDIQALTKDVLHHLDQLGWVKTSQIEVLLTHKIRHGYVHFNHAWQSTVPGLIADLQAEGIHMIGRYGTWDYISMEDGVIGAWDAVDKSLGGS